MMKTTVCCLRSWCSLLGAALCLALPAKASAARLGEIYELARANDARLAAARSAASAGAELAEQGRAGLRPTVSISGDARQVDEHALSGGGRAEYVSSSLGLNASQPLFRPASVAAARQGELQAKLAQQRLQQVEQELRLRVARGYLEVLQAEDAMATLAAQKDAFAQQLAQARRSYEVGLAPITDVSEAQSRYDLTVAQQIAARNDVEVRRRALEKAIGGPLPPLDPLDPDKSVDLVTPADLRELPESAGSTSHEVGSATITEEVARVEVDRQVAGHKPTLDLVASISERRNVNYGVLGGSHSRPRSIGFEFNMPLYQGGIVDSRVREATANLARAESERIEAQRQAVFDAQQAALGVASGNALVQALRQALTSSEMQLRSTRRGLEVGVRTRVDVLNAEQQLFTTRRDLSAARYQTVVATLQLRAAAGRLSDGDLALVDSLLMGR